MKVETIEQAEKLKQCWNVEIQPLLDNLVARVDQFGGSIFIDAVPVHTEDADYIVSAVTMEAVQNGGARRTHFFASLVERPDLWLFISTLLRYTKPSVEAIPPTTH